MHAQGTQRSRWLAMGAFAVIVALHTLSSLSRYLWDDALFFPRFGHNIVHHGVAAWNVADGPVHGNTSQLFQAAATAFVAAAPGYYHASIKIFLGLSIFAAFMAMSTVVSRLGADGSGPRAVLLCGLAAPATLWLIGSGMETMLALAVLAGALLTLARLDAEPDAPGSMGWFVLAHCAVYLVRPDMAVIFVVASAVVLYAPGRPIAEQRCMVRGLGLALAGITLVLISLKLYYGTAFPLSMYLKSRLLTPYDADYQHLGVVGGYRQLVTWGIGVAASLYIAAFGRSRWTLALLLGAGAFVVLHLGSTLPIMGYQGRFYQPASVPVVLAGALGWPAFTGRRSGLRALPLIIGVPAAIYLACRWGMAEGLSGGFYLSRATPWTYAMVAAMSASLGLATLVPRWMTGVLPVVVAVAGTAYGVPPAWPGPLDDASSVRGIRRHMKAMLGVHVVAECMAEPLHIYHSELGVPGVLFVESRITDLSGLMNPSLAFGSPPFDAYCLADPPDVLFLPHRTHARLNAEIQQSECLTHYVRPSGNSEGSSLYIREDHQAAFEACYASMGEDQTQGG